MPFWKNASEEKRRLDELNSEFEIEAAKKYMLFCYEKEKKGEGGRPAVSNQERLKTHPEFMCAFHPYSYVILLDQKGDQHKVYFKNKSDLELFGNETSHKSHHGYDLDDDQEDDLEEKRWLDSFQNRASTLPEGCFPYPYDKKHPNLHYEQNYLNNQFYVLESQLKKFGFRADSAQKAFKYRALIKERLELSTASYGELDNILEVIADHKQIIDTHQPVANKNNNKWLIKLKIHGIALEISKINRHVPSSSIFVSSQFNDLLKATVEEARNKNQLYLIDIYSQGPKPLWESILTYEDFKEITLKIPGEEKYIYIKGAYKAIATLFNGLETTKEYKLAKFFIEKCKERALEPDRFDCLSGLRTKRNKIVVYLKVINNIYAGRPLNCDLNQDELSILWEVKTFGRKSRSARAVQSFFLEATASKFNDKDIELAMRVKSKRSPCKGG